MPTLVPKGPYLSATSSTLDPWQERARWPEWTFGRGAMATGLVVVSLCGGLVLAGLAIGASWCDLFGSTCAANQLRNVRLLVAATPIALLAGPATVAGLRRRPVWVVAPAVAMALLGLLVLAQR